MGKEEKKVDVTYTNKYLKPSNEIRKKNVSIGTAPKPHKEEKVGSIGEGKKKKKIGRQEQRQRRVNV